MKILFDHQIFTHQQYGGISRYFFELIKKFDNVNNSCNVATLFTDNAYYNKSFNPKLNRILPDANFRGKSKITKNLNVRKSVSEIKNGNFDIFHPTYYNDYFLKNIGNKPFVVTFYDMIHEKFANTYSELSNDLLTCQFKKILAQKASRIIAISETTKNDIIDIYGIDKEKIDVVYLGNSLANDINEVDKIIEEDYILFIGNRLLYKNFEGFVTVVAPLLIENNLKLVCGGGGEFSLDEVEFINRMSLWKQIILIKKIDDKILSNLYKNALFFAFPSLYEGFGIPVLEAFASSCPALLSNGGSLPEIGGDAAVYFDINDQDSLYKSASNLINSHQLREELREKGNKRLPNFSWDNTFRNTLSVYNKII